VACASEQVFEAHAIGGNDDQGKRAQLLAVKGEGKLFWWDRAGLAFAHVVANVNDNRLNVNALLPWPNADQKLSSSNRGGAQSPGFAKHLA